MIFKKSFNENNENDLDVKNGKSNNPDKDELDYENISDDCCNISEMEEVIFYKLEIKY